MAFQNKKNYFGLSTTALDITTDADGRSASTAQAKGQDGSIVATTVYGENISPSNDFVLKTAWETETGTELKLGTVTSTTDATPVKVMLNKLSINTGSGTAPTGNASGEQVESGAATSHYYLIPPFTVQKIHHAQILWDAFTLSGTGCHLNSANYTASCSITKSTKEGVCVSSDVADGKLECQVSIVQTGSTVPTLTLAQNTSWVITAPLACTNPDADYPTWSATLQMPLVHGVVATAG